MSSPTFIKSPTSTTTTRDLQRKEERMSRTMEVKRRLGPIMDRMRASLDKIQVLEDKINLRPLPPTESSSSSQQEGKTRGRQDRDGKEEGTGKTSTALVPSRSRLLLKSSMEMIKRKIYKLQHLESLLQDSEDRRQNLQHFFLQSSLSRQALALASSERRNKELTKQVDELEREVALLEQKCVNVDRLQHKVISLSEEVREMPKAQSQLEQIATERDMLELDLVQRQSKLNQQAIRCDDLECQVEQLTVMCDDLLNNLTTQEERADTLERELAKAQRLQFQKPTKRRGRSRPPTTIQSKESCDTASTESTSSDTDNDCSTLESSVPNDPSMDQEESTASPDQYGADFPTNGSICLPGDVRIPQGLEGAVLVQRLLAKIEALDRENARLLQSQKEAKGKFRRLDQENSKQSARITELETQLQLPQHQRQQQPQSPQCATKEAERNSSDESSSPKPEKTEGRGFFLRRILQADAQQFKQLLETRGNVDTKKAAKARQISEGLAAHQAPAKQ